MIYFYGEGRLGNQVFQYHAIARISRPGERILAVGLEDIGRSLEAHGPKVTVLTRSATLKRLVKYVVNPLLMRPLARVFRLFSYGYEAEGGVSPHIGPSGEMSLRRGLLRGFTFIDGGFYQNSSYWESVFPSAAMGLKASLRDSARRYLNEACKGARPTFVHVRRGDYLTHTDYGLSDLSLPAGFYRSAIRELHARAGVTRVVFVTDDPSWVEDNFPEIPDKIVVSSDAASDFAIMTECAGGVISNSTFSLAAALMSDPLVVIAPLYWMGFRPEAWYPPKIQFAHAKLIYLPVTN